MASDFGSKLAAAVGAEPPEIGEIQRLYNDFKRHLAGRAFETPLPELVYISCENFPYLIKLKCKDQISGEWRDAYAKVVIPMLDASVLDEGNCDYDRRRARSLLNFPELLLNPNCIHENLRHTETEEGGIRGRYVYVEYIRKKQRRVGFTVLDPPTNRIVPVSSFWPDRAWVKGCAKSPAIYIRNRSRCTCCE